MLLILFLHRDSSFTFACLFSFSLSYVATCWQCACMWLHWGRAASLVPWLRDAVSGQAALYTCVPPVYQQHETVSVRQCTEASMQFERYCDQGAVWKISTHISIHTSADRWSSTDISCAPACEHVLLCLAQISRIFHASPIHRSPWHPSGQMSSWRPVDCNVSHDVQWTFANSTEYSLQKHASHTRTICVCLEHALHVWLWIEASSCRP